MEPIDLSRVVVVDLEATCWDAAEHEALAANQGNETEVVEIGAVRCPPHASDPFRAVVKPRRHPQLSGFCRQLTGLSQADVDAGMPFAEAFKHFLAWAGPGPLIVASWGSWDDRQLRRDAGRHQLAPPVWTPLNIKRRFATLAKAQGAPRGGWMSLTRSLEWLGLGFEGQPHRAVDDAVNAARVLAWTWEASQPSR